MAHGRHGRPSKGERQRIEVRVPPALKRAAEQAAAEGGMTLMDYIGGLMAESTGVPYSAQEAIPLLRAI